MRWSTTRTIRCSRAIGPNKDDIFQGSVGGCYFMSRLSAIAMQHPEYIRKLVAPLGDGSYAVRFYRNEAEDYVRVDADLWANKSQLVYAREGHEGAIWVPAVEKAFAIARRDQPSYASIGGGNGTTLSSIEYEPETSTINDGLTAEQVAAWHASGEPAGNIQTTLEGSVRFLLVVIDYYLNQGYPLTTGAVSGIKDTTPIRLDDPATSAAERTYRRGQHICQNDHVSFDADDDPNGLVLRDRTWDAPAPRSCAPSRRMGVVVGVSRTRETGACGDLPRPRGVAPASDQSSIASGALA